MENVEKLLKSNAVWSSLTAVKNDRYYVLDKTLYNNKPNKRWGEAYQQLADILYPASK
jgi:iron complex transport system substrate-binding protein